MKNNTMKRVLAATLSLLTVAAYAPANVGGLLTGGSAIVANAAVNVLDYHEYTYASISQEKCSIFDYSATPGVKERTIEDTTITLNGTDQDGNIKFDSENEVKISIAGEKLISTVVFEGTPADADYTKTGFSDGSTVKKISKYVLFNNVLSDSITIKPNVDSMKFKKIKVYYVDKIDLTDNNVEAANLYYSPGTSSYSMEPKYKKDTTTAFTLSSSDFDITSMTKDGTATTASASVSGAGDYSVTVTGKGLFKGTATFNWNVEKYPMAFSGNNANIRLKSSNVSDPAENDTFTYGTADNNGTWTPNTNTYGAAVQALKRDIATGDLADSTSDDNWVQLTPSTDYTYSTSASAENRTASTNAQNAGAYVVKVEGTGNYTGGDTKFWQVDKANIEATDYTAPTAKTDLLYTGSADSEKKEVLNTVGTFADKICVPAGATAPKFQYQLTSMDVASPSAGQWVDSIPTAAGVAGQDTSYKIFYRIIGGDNYNDVAFDTNNFVTATISRKTATFKLQDLNDVVLINTTDNNAVLTPDANGIYTVKASDVIKLYSKQVVAQDGTVVSDTVQKNQKYNEENYDLYTINIPDVPSEESYIISHTHATKVISAVDADSSEKDKAYVVDQNDATSTPQLVATLSDENNGIKDTYLFGEAPTDNNVSLTSGTYGTSTKLTDFYYYLKGDPTSARLTDPNQLTVGNTYVVVANIEVKLGTGDPVHAYITKEFKYEARPLSECEVYVEGSEAPLDIDEEGNVNVPDFTYNKTEQKPNIIIKNTVHGTTIELTADDYTDALVGQKNVGDDYSGELTGNDTNYTGKLTINWKINKAANGITLVPKSDIVYDGRTLDITDFEVTDPNEILSGSEPDVETSVEGTDLLNAGSDKTASIRITSKNYTDFEATQVAGINIAKREVKATPAEDQSTVYGVAPKIEYTLEESNGNRGLATPDKAAEEIIKNAVKLKDYNTSDLLENNAGEYEYEAAELDNYVVQVVGADTNKFTVDPMDISNGFEVKIVGNTEGQTAETDSNNVLYYTYDGETNFAVKVVSVTGGEDSYYNLVNNEDKTDYIVKGATSRITAGNYEVQVEGKGNYTGRAVADWAVRAASVNGVVIKIDDEVIEDEISSITKTYDGETHTAVIDYSAADDDYKKNVKGVSIEYRDDKGKKLNEAPKNAGTYSITATVKADGYQDSTITKTLEITPADLENTEQRLNINFGQDATLDYSGEGKGYTKLTADMIDNIQNFNDADKALVKEAVNDGSLVFNWTAAGARQYNGTITAKGEISDELDAILNTNYNWSNTGFILNVTPKSIKSEDIEIIYDASTVLGDKDNVDADGWTINNITVVDKTTGQTLVENTDYVVNNNDTKLAGNFNIEIIGQGNYNSYVEKNWVVVENYDEIVNFNERESYVAINPANSKLYVKVGFNPVVNNDKFTAIESGIIYSQNGINVDTAELKLENVDGENIKKSSRTLTNIFDRGRGITAVGYVKLLDEAGKEVIAYSNNIGGNTILLSEDKPAANINPDTGNEYVKIRFEASIEKKDYEVTEFGILYNNDGTVTDVSELTLDKVDDSTIRKSDKTLTNIRDYGSGVTAVGYAVIKNADGQMAYFYTDDIGGMYSELAAQD